MPINGISQPNIIPISATLRLRNLTLTQTNYEIAWPWYQDRETVWLVDGKDEPYRLERIERMYTYLAHMGELYFIEKRKNHAFVPIGDVTFCSDDLPIVLGNRDDRGHGIGKQVVRCLIARARQLGWSKLSVQEIYDVNLASQRMFLSLGFVRTGKTARGHRYQLDLMKRWSS